MKNFLVAAIFFLGSFEGVTFDQKALDVGFTCASYLSDPLLRAHLWRWQIPLTETLHQEASQVEIVARKTLYGLGAFTTAISTVVHSTLGLLLRNACISLQENPFLYCRGSGLEKNVSEKFSLLSWNLCCLPGGFSITDAGVLPWSHRIKNLIKTINLQNKDIVCLFEIFDIQTAHAFIEGLKNDYAHFYYCIGPKTLGVSSGLFVASKMKITDPAFTVFPRDALAGKGKFSNKGFFSFGIKNGDIKIYTTHLGHSEVPDFPSQIELRGRQKQIEMILAQMRDDASVVKILTGDLNMDEKEFNQHQLNEIFDRGIIGSTDTTWGGDSFGSRYITKKVGSLPTTLDYALVFKNQRAQISTSYIDTGYNGEEFQPKALSDHKGLVSVISLK